MISIVIPAFEEERIIGKTLTWLKTELKIPHEVIVSDGRSTDKTVEIANKLADTVIVFDGEKHSPALGRNDGARIAQGEFLLFLDADSMIFNVTEALTKAIKRFESDSTLVALAGPQWVHPDHETIVDRIVFGIDNINNHSRNNILKSGWACGKCMMVRKSAFEQVGGFDEKLVFGEDWDMFKRLAKIGKTRYDRTIAVHHMGRRLHAYGWARFWFVWAINGIWVTLFGKAYVDAWTPVR